MTSNTESTAEVDEKDSTYLLLADGPWCQLLPANTQCRKTVCERQKRCLLASRDPQQVLTGLVEIPPTFWEQAIQCTTITSAFRAEAQQPKSLQLWVNVLVATGFSTAAFSGQLAISKDGRKVSFQAGSQTTVLYVVLQERPAHETGPLWDLVMATSGNCQPFFTAEQAAEMFLLLPGSIPTTILDLPTKESESLPLDHDADVSLAPVTPIRDVDEPTLPGLVEAHMILCDGLSSDSNISVMSSSQSSMCTNSCAWTQESEDLEDEPRSPNLSTPDKMSDSDTEFTTMNLSPPLSRVITPPKPFTPGNCQHYCPPGTPAWRPFFLQRPSLLYVNEAQAVHARLRADPAANSRAVRDVWGCKLELLSPMHYEGFGGQVMAGDASGQPELWERPEWWAGPEASMRAVVGVLFDQQA